MRVAVTALGLDLEGTTSPIFGRCPALVFVDTETMECEGLANPSAGAGGGAGVQAAQLVIDQGARAVLTHNVGPNAFAALQAAGITVYRIEGGTVRQAVEALVAGRLPRLDAPNARVHLGARDGP